MVCDLDNLYLAAFRDYFRARHEGVRIDARENGALGHAVSRVFEDKFVGFEFSEIHEGGILFFPGQKLRREMARMEIDSAGFFHQRK